METKNKSKEVKKEAKTELVKRKDYKFLIDYFQSIKDLDLTQSSNKEKVKSLYIESSNNKVFSNIERVIKRSLREEIKPILESELKASKLTLSQYQEISYKVIAISRNKQAKLIQVEAKI